MIWVNPVSGAINLLIGLRIGDEIVQVGTDPDGNQMRWVFTDFQPNSARWMGERSEDSGETWVLEAEFFLSRMVG